MEAKAYFESLEPNLSLRIELEDKIRSILSPNESHSFVIINGPSSSGKTGLIRLLQDLTPSFHMTWERSSGDFNSDNQDLFNDANLIVIYDSPTLDILTEILCDLRYRSAAHRKANFKFIFENVGNFEDFLTNPSSTMLTHMSQDLKKNIININLTQTFTGGRLIDIDLKDVVNYLKI